MRKVTLQLSDGTEFHGKSFGYEQPVAGEVVFNTAMMGYPESLTDPSYAGQLLTMTFPLVGNYGVPPFTFDKQTGLPDFMESDRIYASALIVSDYSEQYSHWNAVESLGEWLQREKVPGITGIDTRELTKVLREHGVMMGKILFDDEPNNVPEADYEGVNFVDRVSVKEIVRYNEGAGRKVVLVDCGVKANIIRELIQRGVEVVRVPWNYDYTDMEFDGLFLANGPGDPDMCSEAVEIIRKQMSRSRKPICGICMGNQLLSKAAGATIYKLKYGHRGHNQPVRMVGTEKCFITSQNHGYAVVGESVDPKIARVRYVNLNDGTVEMIDNPSSYPDPSNIVKQEEPFVDVHLYTPNDYVGALMDLCQQKRGVLIDMKYLDDVRVDLHYALPLGEIVYDFFDAIKSRSRGYASYDYEFKEYRESDLVKLDFLLNGDPVDALSMIVFRDNAYAKGRRICEKLRDNIPRTLFEIPVQAAIGGKIIARETVKAMRKDVLAKCYGGDISRKKKLLEKQKEGKKKMRQLGSVSLPSEAFTAVLKLDSDDD